MYAQVTNNVTQAIQYSCHMIDPAMGLKSFRVGGSMCLACRSSPTAGVSENELNSSRRAVPRPEDAWFLRHGLRAKMRKQNLVLKTRLRSRRALRRVHRLTDHRVG